MKGEQSLPFLLACHLSNFTWGLQSVPPGTRQATQMRAALGQGGEYTGEGDGNPQQVAMCSALASYYREGTWGLEVPDLAIFKETIEIWIFK